MRAQVDGLWKVLCPLIRTALTNITMETYTDWGTCIATACVSSSHTYKYSFLYIYHVKMVEDQIKKKIKIKNQ